MGIFKVKFTNFILTIAVLVEICQPINFTEEPIPTLAIINTDTQINCSVLNYEGKTLSWLWHTADTSTQISLGDYVADKDYALMEGSTGNESHYHLYIASVTTKFQRDHECRAYDQSISKRITLYVIESGPTCQVYPGLTTIQGHETIFNCSSENGVPPGETVWIVNGKEESRNASQEHIFSRSFTREENGATLYCGIDYITLPPASESNLLCDEITMNVEFPPIVNVTKTTNNVVVEGDDYFAECEIQEMGNPAEIDDWYWLLPNGNISDNLTLLLENATREDNGTYKCVAQNIYYDQTKGYGTASVELSVHYRPFATVTDESNWKVIEGKQYSALCEVDANPPAVVSWTDPDSSRLSSTSQLDLTNVKRTDGGIYTCHANNTFFNKNQGYGSAMIELDVQYNASLQATVHGDASNSGSVIIGDGIYLECSVIDANPDVTAIYWQDTSGNDSRWLNLTTVSRDDHGLHTCIATTEFWDQSEGTGSTEIFVDVQYSPQIEDFEHTTFVVEERQFEKLCNVSSNPPPHVQWMTSTGTVSNSEILRFENVMRDQSGDYTCEAKTTFWNNVTVNDTQTFNLDVQYPPRLGLPMGYVSREYENVTLTCNVLDANPASVQFTWLLPQGDAMSGSKLILIDVIRSMTGFYVCIGNNTYYDGTEGSGTKTTYLDVQFGPEIVVDASSNRIKENGKVTLQCTVTSNPPATHEWTKDGDVITSELVHTIEMIKRQDAGVYNCSAETAFDDGDVGIGFDTTEVIVEYIADVEVTGPTDVLIEGNQTKITCTVTDGIPDPHSITLYHVNETTNEVDTVVNEDGVTNHTFDLGVIERRHNGSYYCAATTEFFDGSFDNGTSSSVLIIVHYAPSITNKGDDAVTATIGEAVNLQCNVDAYPLATITWMKGSTHRGDGEILRIASVSDVDEGEYTCTATNYVGSDVHKIQLTVEEKPTKQPTTQIPVTLIAGISGGILLLIIIIIVLAVMIKRQKKPTDNRHLGSEMAALNYDSPPEAFSGYDNPENIRPSPVGMGSEAANGMEDKRGSDMFTEEPISSFGETNTGGKPDDIDDPAILYAQPIKKSIKKDKKDSISKKPDTDQKDEEMPPQEPPRLYNTDKNAEGLVYADLDHAGTPSASQPKKPPVEDEATEYATVDIQKTAAQAKGDK